MNENDGFAPIQFLEDWSIRVIAQPLAVITGEQSDSLGLQHIKRVLDFTKAAFHVRKRDHCE